MSQSIVQQAEALIFMEKYYPARKLILQELKKNPTDTQLWRPLANTYLNQGYIREAYEIYAYLQLLYPKDTTYKTILDKIEPFLKTANPQVTFFNQIISLKKSTITVAMIFKNEIDTIQRWYESIQNKVDQIIAINTGSTDGTLEYLEKQNDVQLIDSPWNNSFSEARNAANEFITSDWVLWVDSDEYFMEAFDGIESIRFIADYYETFGLDTVIQITIHNLIDGKVFINHESSRMYKAKNYHFEGRIHEQIVPINNNIIQVPIRFYSGIAFLHTGYDSSTMINKNKLERNLTLLKLDAIENPKSAFTFLLLGRESRLLGAYEEALKYLKIAEENVPNDQYFSRILDVYANMILTQVELNLLDDAIETCQKALKIDPKFPNALYYLNALRLQKARQLLADITQDISSFEQAVFEYRGDVEADFAILNGGHAILKAELLKNAGCLAEAKNVLTALPSEQLTEEAHNLLSFIEIQSKKLQ